MGQRPFAFFTTKPNDIVGPIHEKAMPVNLDLRARAGRPVARAIGRGEGATAVAAGK